MTEETKVNKGENHVATLIYRKLLDREKLVGEDLRTQFKKKVAMDSKAVLDHVSKLVEAHIQTKMQPLHSSIDLAKVEGEAVFGAKVTTTDHYQEVDAAALAALPEEELKFVTTHKNGTQYRLMPSAVKTRVLVEHAINVIGLEWNLSYGSGGTYHVHVSWRHWSQT